MPYIGIEPQDQFRGLSDKESFTGNGSTTVFDLSKDAPADGGENELEVYVDNIRQEPGTGKAYTLGRDGSSNIRRITFSAAPASGADIYVINPTNSTSVVRPSDGTVSNLSLNASMINSQTALGGTPANDDEVLIYDTSATALKKVTKSNLLTGFTNSFVKFTGNGSTTAYTILSGRTVSDVLVFVDGSHMTPSDDYTISGTTLTFGSAPANSKVIIIRYLQI